MSALFIIALTVIVTAGLFSIRGQVLPSSTQFSPPPTIAPSATPRPITSPSPSVRPSSPPATSTPLPVDQVQSAPVGSLIYPGSRKISDSVYETGDDTDAITDWYKAKINSLGYNVTTFVTTSANDKILNKLVGAKPGEELSIEISKNPSDSTARITIHLDN